MAEAAAKQSESMEDILQSIKRIIEDDGDAKPQNAPAAAGSDVLDLTQVIKDDGTITTITPLPLHTAAPTPEPAKPAPAAPPLIPAVTPAEPPAPKPLQMEEGLVSDQAAQAAAAALKPLSETGQKDITIPRVPAPVMRSGNTVEDLVVEALKPMLKAWLDEHLALIVQKIVEKEVRRIVNFNKD